MQPRALMGAALALAALLGVSLTVAVLLAPAAQLAANDTRPVDAAAEVTWGRPAVAPVPSTAPAGPGVANTVDSDWLATTAERTGIPLRALAAYAGVALAKSAAMPECGLAWNTLAAIGFAESRHATHGDAILGDDGTVTPGIFGVALAGAGTAHIPDSDDGLFDGDAEYDRAVGPMQLIPQTWRNWHIDASGDGVEDPQNLDDATMATANYLCRSTGDMSTEDGWRTGVAAYNSADSYMRVVASEAEAYAG